jgi:predicted PurR-regulated permease PerM
VNFETWIGLIALLVSLLILWQIHQIILLLFTAVIVADSLNILVKRCQQWGIKRYVAVSISVSLFLAVLVGFFGGIVPSFIKQSQQIIMLVPQGIEQLNIWLDWLTTRVDPELIESLPDINELIAQWQPLVNQLLGGGLTFFYDSLGALVSLLLLLVLSSMLLAEPEPYREVFVRLFPSFYRRRVEQILLLCDRSLQRWLTGILFNMGITGVFSYLVLLILGIPLALAQAMLAGVLNFIPYIGPVLSAVIPMAIALIDAPWKAIAVAILYCLIQQLQTHLLNPLLRIEQPPVLPAVTLLAQVFFATFFGVLGLFIALPLLVVGQVWVQEVLIGDILDKWKGKGDRTKEALSQNSHYSQTIQENIPDANDRRH